MVLNLNAVMSVIFNVPAAIASTVSLLQIFVVFSSKPTRFMIQIVASRAVRRLQNFSFNGPEVLYVSLKWIPRTSARVD
jgi:hypothetical protein